MIISIDADKAFDKIQHPFVIKILTNVGPEGIYLNKLKVIYDKPTVNLILNSEKMKAFLLNLGTRQGCAFSPFLLKIMLEALATVITQEKEKKRYSNCKWRDKTVTICRWHDTLYIEAWSFHTKTIRANKLIQKGIRIQDWYTEICCISLY